MTESASTAHSAYRYRAAALDGSVVEGVIAAATQQGALNELRRKRLYPVEVTAVVPAQNRAVRPARMGRGPAVALYARTLATLLAAGVGLERALLFAAQQARHAEVTRAGHAVAKRVQAGARLGEALADHPRIFGPHFSALVSAGEESGALEDAVARVADQLDLQIELHAQIRAALLYPAIMAVASLTGIVVLLIFVVPRFVEMLAEEGGVLPWSTRLLVGASNIAAHSWWAILLLGMLGAGLLRGWLAAADNRRRWHAWRLRLPLAGELEYKYSAARFTRALGMMLANGSPILPALRAARASITNSAVSAQIEGAIHSVSQGERVSAALRETLPPLAAELIAVGEESGRLDELCIKTADTYDVEVRRSLRSIVAVIEPALILLFGLIVGFVALAMLQAIYSVNRSAF